MPPASETMHATKSLLPEAAGDALLPLSLGALPHAPRVNAAAAPRAAKRNYFI